MARDKRVFALTADIGFRNFDEIIADFPDQFVNVGVAEADMIGIAAGLALSGKIPFAFTIASFVTMRCLEQIRIDLCFQKLPVKIIGTGGGFVYGPQGTTHHAIEDIGILRTLPHMTVISPADPVETGKAVCASIQLDGPVYIRIGRNHEPILYSGNYNFKIGEAVTMRKGDDVSIIAHGLVVKNSLEAADILAREDISVRVVNMHTIKPVDREMILKCAEETGCILTVEEHNVIGGLGSAVAEILAEELFRPVLFKRLGLKDTYLRIHAEHSHLQQKYGLDSNSIADAAKRLLLEKKLGKLVAI
jgi:transketolase